MAFEEARLHLDRGRLYQVLSQTGDFRRGFGHLFRRHRRLCLGQ